VGKRERDAAKKENRTEEAAEGARIEGETASRETEGWKELNEKSSGDEENEKRGRLGTKEGRKRAKLAGKR
jgi:hypothetical protein